MATRVSHSSSVFMAVGAPAASQLLGTGWLIRYIDYFGRWRMAADDAGSVPAAIPVDVPH